MLPMGQWSVLLLLSLTSIVHSQSCKWLHPKQEYLNTQILKAFNEMMPLKETEEICEEHPTDLPNTESTYSVSQVEAGALAVREVLNETMRFYMKHHESMGCKQQAWERFQQLLYYQIHQLEACVSQTEENDLLKESISEEFNLLETMVLEKDNSACVWDFIHLETRRNLQQVLQLSSRLRRQRLLQRPQ
ncbi:interferon beta [Xenopus tropicalis]|uniref:Interferon beta n=1 Tax=Xenopus tropicalis TaxID=8364 RepID=A8E6F6_XENTR|nr:interferon beta [Xenopus tropicalis]ANQ43259.1 type I interferon 4 [Xenopus tropicalis]CAO03088.1 TPA: type I interferon 4 [Xenopus tropicalis]|eukprot:XP_012808078.1 PREDICTED: interferon beta [Xenopus tropicalis]